MNRLSFDTTKPNGKQQFLQQLNALLEYNQDSENQDFNDIHIYQEDYLIIIEWERTRYNGHDGRWEYLDSDEEVMKEIRYPDGSYEMVYPWDESHKMEQWHAIHPEWVRTCYGTWTNIEETRRFIEESREELPDAED